MNPWLNIRIIRQTSTIIVSLCVLKMIYKIGKNSVTKKKKKIGKNIYNLHFIFYSKID